MLFDTHAHLDTYWQEGSLDAVLSRASAAGVARVVAMGGDPHRNEVALSIARSCPGRVVAAIGLDRDGCAVADLEERIDEVRSRLKDPAVVAVGEMGLDYHYEPDSAAAQQALFRRMAALARDAGLPLVVHSREAQDDTAALLREHLCARGGSERAGVLHCFTGDAACARRLVDLGMYISFSGMLTFRNAASIREAAAVVPADRLLIETDAPYLAPVPRRGRTNEPAFLVHVADALARIRGWSREELDGITTRNANRLFGRAWDSV